MHGSTAVSHVSPVQAAVHVQVEGAGGRRGAEIAHQVGVVPGELGVEQNTKNKRSNCSNMRIKKWEQKMKNIFKSEEEMKTTRMETIEERISILEKMSNKSAQYRKNQNRIKQCCEGGIEEQVVLVEQNVNFEA